jgi:hypothetical protein
MSRDGFLFTIGTLSALVAIAVALFLIIYRPVRPDSPRLSPKEQNLPAPQPRSQQEHATSGTRGDGMSTYRVITIDHDGREVRGSFSV